MFHVIFYKLQVLFNKFMLYVIYIYIYIYYEFTDTVYRKFISLFDSTHFEYLVKPREPREPGNQGNQGTKGTKGTREPGNQGNQGTKGTREPGNQGNNGTRGTREQMFLFISQKKTIQDLIAPWFP